MKFQIQLVTIQGVEYLLDPPGFSHGATERSQTQVGLVARNSGVVKEVTAAERM